MPQQPKSKPSTADQRANEALERAAPEGKSPARKALSFLLEGSHDQPTVPDQAPGQLPPLPTTHQESPPLPTLARETIAPARDFNRRANSLERDAMPSGLFPGSSKKIYDALYLRTIGAIVPRSSVRASRRDLLEWTGIKNLKTIDNHIRHLMTVGLIVRHWELGSTEGSEYEVRLPEDLPRLPTTPHQSPSATTSQKTGSGNPQFSGSGGESQSIENTHTSEFPKTSFKTKEEKTDDDAALALLCDKLQVSSTELTGKPTTQADRERWGEVADVLIAELKIAAARTTVSNVPAFLAEHLRRRLWKIDKKQARAEGRELPDQKSEASSQVDASGCPDCGGANWYYPEGEGKGVKKCKHVRLNKAGDGEIGNPG